LPLPEQLHRRSFAIDEAHPSVPAPVQNAQNYDPGELLRRIFIVEIPADLLSLMPLLNPRFPQKVDGFSLDNPLRQNPSELRPKRIQRRIAPPSYRRNHVHHDQNCIIRTRSSQCSPRA
jgi:hypothetical protein